MRDEIPRRPQPQGGNAFQAAFAAAHTAAQAAHHAANLEHRVIRRWRLWERDDNTVGLRLEGQKHVAIAAAEEAEWYLDSLWDALSRVLPPLQGTGLLAEASREEFLRAIGSNCGGETWP
jgi:hypothetical protein